MSCPAQRLGRRAFLGVLGVGLAAITGGCAAPDNAEAPPVGGASPGPDVPPRPVRPVAPIPRAHGQLELHSGPPGSVAARRIAITVDDGFCAHCVAAYADLARRTGIHLTFSPNGRYAKAWDPQAPVLRPLIEAGQVQLMNHTFTHRDLTKLVAGDIRGELERNERWIGETFATTTRPYFRPPFGRRAALVDETAADAGFDRMILWDGSYSDSKLITPEFLMQQARQYLQAGVILLGHANHPTVLGLFGPIQDLITERGLRPVTLDELFATRRPARPA